MPTQGKKSVVTEPVDWSKYSDGTLLTSPEAAELVARLTRAPFKSSTWRAYQTKWRKEGLIPAPKRMAGPTALYDAGEVTHWATHRLGRGRRRDLPTTPRKS